MLEKIHLRKAKIDDTAKIWAILQQAIERRRKDGSSQWQDGYPNPESIKHDLENNNAYVLVSRQTILGYAAVIINDEPAYEKINGKWLSNSDFIVVHRVAIADEYLGKSLSKEIFKEIEILAISQQIYSIKVDTNFDNLAMLKILEALGYQYCGEVEFRGGKRKAFEKLLEKSNS